MTIILGGDSLNKTFPLKEQDARNLFFFHNSRELFFVGRRDVGCDKVIKLIIISHIICHFNIMHLVVVTFFSLLYIYHKFLLPILIISIQVKIF